MIPKMLHSLLYTSWIHTLHDSASDRFHASAMSVVVRRLYSRASAREERQPTHRVGAGREAGSSPCRVGPYSDQVASFGWVGDVSCSVHTTIARRGNLERRRPAHSTGASFQHAICRYLSRSHSPGDTTNYRYKMALHARGLSRIESLAEGSQASHDIMLWRQV